MISPDVLELCRMLEWTTKVVHASHGVHVRPVEECVYPICKQSVAIRKKISEKELDHGRDQD